MKISDLPGMILTHNNTWIMFLVLIVICSGCIEMGANDESAQGITLPATPIPATPMLTISPSSTGMTTAQPAVNIPAPGKSMDAVSYTDPIPPKNAISREYRNLTSNDTPLEVPGYYSANEIFQGSYILQNNNIGLLANISSAPFIIDVHIGPGSQNPNDSFFVITLRDNKTKKIVGEDGYGRLYSAETDKHLIFRSPGVYHINLYGDRVWVAISVKAGGGGYQEVQVTPVPYSEEQVVSLDETEDD
jgi:hypothetical protein